MYVGRLVVQRSELICRSQHVISRLSIVMFIYFADAVVVFPLVDINARWH